VATIGDKTITETGDMLQGHLWDYRKSIDEAYCECDNALTVTLKAKYSPSGSGVKIDTAIDFIAEKIKDSSSRIIDENQQPLPLKVTSGDKSREILFRNFDAIRALLKRLGWMQDDWKKTGLIYRRF